MPEVTPYQTPQDAALALIRDHAENIYGIKDADPLKVVADFMLNTKFSPELRLKAATTALKYTRTELRSTQVDVTGKIDHEHSHVVEQATKQLFTLLDTLQQQKFEKAEDAQLVLSEEDPPTH